MDNKTEQLIAAARHWRRCKDAYHDCELPDIHDPLREYREAIKRLSRAVDELGEDDGEG